MIVLQSAVNEATFEVLYNALMVTKTQLNPGSPGRSLQTERNIFLTLPAAKNESPNLGKCSQALRSC